MAKPVNSDEITLEGSDELREVALEMTLNCHRNLDIISRHLDPVIFDNQAFANAVKLIALNNRAARIRLLVMDVAPVISRGHRLLELASRLSSFITIRKPSRDYKHFNEAMLLADNNTYIHRRLADRYDGIATTTRFVARRTSKADLRKYGNAQKLTGIFGAYISNVSETANNSRRFNHFFALRGSAG